MSFNIERPIYEFGAREAEGQTPGFGNLRSIFTGPYVGIDYRDGVGVDLVDDIMHSKFETNSVPTIFAFDTFEHVINPFRAMNTIYRILKRDTGLFCMSVPFKFFIHAQPDYWRYTPEGVDILLSGFNSRLVFGEGEVDNPHTVFGIGSMQIDFDFSKFLEMYKTLEQQREETAKQRGWLIPLVLRG